MWPSACSIEVPLFGADRQAIGGDELRLDADEVEDAAQIGFEMLERRRRRIRIVEAATREGDDHALALARPSGPFAV